MHSINQIINHLTDARDEVNKSIALLARTEDRSPEENQDLNDLLTAHIKILEALNAFNAD